MTPLSARADRVASTRRTASSFRPRVEALEDRTLLASHFFNVPGTPGELATLRFNWTFREARFNNEVGVFAVGSDGRVDGVAPGDPRYLQTVMRSASRQVLFDSSTGAGNLRTLSFTAGTQLAFYIIQDTTSSTLLKTNPSNTLGGGRLAWFSTSDANRDGRDHVRVSNTGGATRFAWEDLTSLGDADFNDVVFDVRRVGAGEVNPNFRGRALLTPGKANQTVATTFTMLQRDPSFAGEIGLFRVDTPDGTIGALKPGDPGYTAAALAASRRTQIFNASQATGASGTVDLPGGTLFGVYLVRNGTADQAIAGQAQPLFSFLDANPADSDLMRQFRDNVFGFETGGDADFRDVLISFQFGTPRDSRESTPPTLTARLRTDTGSSATDRTTSDPSVTGTVADASGIRLLRAGLDSTPPAAFRDVTPSLLANGTFTLDAAQMASIAGGVLTPGNHVLHLEATDNAGNLTTFDLTFFFDQVAPPLAFDLTAATDTDPDGDQITQLPTVELRAVTDPGLRVRLVQTGQEVVADSSGIALFTGVQLASGANDFTMTATDTAGNQATARRVVTRNDAPTVQNAIADQTLNSNTPFMTDLDAVFADANIVNSIARFNTNMGEFDVELFDANANGVTPRAGDTARTTPGHVANFIQYVDSTDPARNYTDTIVHRNGRSQTGGPFVIQGGGFKVDPGDFPTDLNEFGTVTNEPGNSNLRGTIALARGQGVNSGSSQWFVNVTDNTFLDTSNQGFTAFGRVLGTGMNVVDAMSALQNFNVTNEFPVGDPRAGAFGELPLKNYTGGVAGYPEAASRDNYVVINNVTMWRRKDGMVFTASTDQPGVATVGINPANGELTVSRVGTGPGAPTVVTVTVRATDTHGAFVEDTFTVTVS